MWVYLGVGVCMGFLDVGLTIVATRKPEVKLNQKQNVPKLSQLREKKSLSIKVDPLKSRC